MSLIRVENLVTRLRYGAHIVDDISFDIAAGETFALLGESGCGKSMTALSLMRLLPDGVVHAGGKVQLNGTGLSDLPEHEMRDVRGGKMAMIFQEPGLSLNPVMTVGAQIAEVLALHCGLGGAAAGSRCIELLDQVGIPDAARRLDEYPFQFSGGMKQRVMIAMALAGNPKLLIADEPTTALDVTIQAQVLQLLRETQSRSGMAMLLITHDLGCGGGDGTSGWRDVRRADHRAGEPRTIVRQAFASLHTEIIRGIARCGTCRTAIERHTGQRTAVGEHSARLPLCGAMRSGVGAVPGADAGMDGIGRGAGRTVPSIRQD